MSERKQAIIFDLDGTLADVAARRKHLDKDPPNWGAFFRDVPTDVPNEPVLTVYKALRAAGFPTVIASGRPGILADATERWLKEHGIEYDDLYMRGLKDNRPDWIVKREMLRYIWENGWDPILVFDDRDSVVQMWRDAGIPTFQVAPGDF